MLSPISKSFLQRDALAHHLEQEYGLEKVNPAMNIEHWGSQYFYSFVDHDLAALKRWMRRGD